MVGQVISLVVVDQTGMSSFESLSSGRAKICVMGVNKSYWSSNQIVCVMFWAGLCGYRKSLSKSSVKSKWKENKSSSK